jgi:hypothetical protein
MDATQLRACITRLDEENAQLKAKNAHLLATLAKVWFDLVEAGTKLEKSLDKDHK